MKLAPRNLFTSTSLGRALFPHLTAARLGNETDAGSAANRAECSISAVRVVAARGSGLAEAASVCARLPSLVADALPVAHAGSLEAMVHPIAV